ncbi:MAG TPA: hypothetical protein VGO93_23190 [Candidatus Xenobia bacterium]
MFRGHFKTALVLRLAIVMLFLGVVGVVTLVDRHDEHQRLITFASLALNAHFSDGQSTDQAAPTQVVAASLVLALTVPLAQVAPSRHPVVSAGRLLGWEDSGIGHMLLTDE